jgi:hypothetical protein
MITLSSAYLNLNLHYTRRVRRKKIQDGETRLYAVTELTR